MICHRWIVGYSWWGWRCWRYFHHSRGGILAVGPLTLFYGRR